MQNIIYKKNSNPKNRKVFFSRLKKARKSNFMKIRHLSPVRLVFFIASFFSHFTNTIKSFIAHLGSAIKCRCWCGTTCMRRPPLLDSHTTHHITLASFTPALKENESDGGE